MKLLNSCSCYTFYCSCVFNTQNNNKRDHIAYQKAENNTWKVANEVVTSGEFLNLFPSFIVPFPAVVTHSQLVLVRLDFRKFDFVYMPVIIDP